MSFEIHVTTIANSSLSFGLKNCWVFWAVEFFWAWVFSKMLKKAWGNKVYWKEDVKDSKKIRLLLLRHFHSEKDTKLERRRKKLDKVDTKSSPYNFLFRKLAWIESLIAQLPQEFRISIWREYTVKNTYCSTEFSINVGPNHCVGLSMKQHSCNLVTP